MSSRTVSPRLATNLLHLREACMALAISVPTFWRRWHSVFTDPRGPDDRRPGCERKVYEDEVATAVSAGGGSRGRVAVIEFRGLMGRTRSN